MGRVHRNKMLEDRSAFTLSSPLVKKMMERIRRHLRID
jgi:hypothetical protein